ncbi:hypothetical protein HYDPIDRAFT_116255 [Hydnomerulius pinastri MD-312]|uniref:Unplaced genomic scaffold scaffold_30, whole genome shotgun sequence n=1 Tax=Hydnomerulius pinastri MD-312 TaxID=994086 RepID=A0A0C9W4C3_9AGAM|nr:hypothetical protein HYDPIDRAFT_116255 [Hydnomerulius pinastri MD-312]
MSPFAKIWGSNNQASTSRIPAEDLQLRVHVSRESDTTSSPSLDSRNSPIPPPPNVHHSTRQLQDDALTDFFGGRGQRMRTQHRAPPPYSPDWDGEKLPEYALCTELEPETVARHMFMYGFFFPLFWAIGVYFLYAPMRVSADWQQDKTEAEKEEILSNMRQTEAKWAKRCLWALLSFFACIIILVIAVVASKRH